MIKGLVSVIIPTYNSAKFVEESVKSALNQTYTNKEVIVIDDGSTDNTKELLEKYKNKIKYIFKENGGPASARNLGIKESSGEFIAFLDSDDVWLSEKLSLQVKFMMDNVDVGVVACNRFFIWEDSDKCVKANSPWNKTHKANVFWELLRGNFIALSSAVARRECFDNIGLFDESEELIGTEDYNMWLRLSRFYKFGFLKGYLYMACWKKISLTSDFEKMYKGDILNIKKVNDLFPELKLARKIYYWKSISRRHYCLADSYFYVGQYKQARREFLKSLQCFVFNIKAICLLFICFFPGLIDSLRKIKLRMLKMIKDDNGK
ncbi:glycosyltransferase family 2 protein [Verrucomicrobiota bacterium]